MKKLLILIPLLLSACSSQVSYVPEELNSTFAKNLAQESVNLLKKHYPPAKTAFFIDKDSLETPFAKELLNNLRTNGYAISNNGIPLNFIIDYLNNKYYLLSLDTPNWRVNATVQITFTNRAIVNQVSQIVKD